MRLSLARKRARGRAIKIHPFAFAVHSERCRAHTRSVSIVLCSLFSLWMLDVLMNDLATIIHHFFVCFYTPSAIATTRTKMEEEEKRQNETSMAPAGKESNFQQKTHSWFDGDFALCLFCFMIKNLLSVFFFILKRMHFVYIVLRWCILHAYVCLGNRLGWCCGGLLANKTILFFLLAFVNSR